MGPRWAAPGALRDIVSRMNGLIGCVFMTQDQRELLVLFQPKEKTHGMVAVFRKRVKRGKGFKSG